MDANWTQFEPGSMMVPLIGRDWVSVSSSGQPADYLSFRPSISADGNMGGLTSLSDNLVPNAPNGDADVFVHVFGRAP